MAAPERFAKRQIPLAPRAPSIHGPSVSAAAVRPQLREAGAAEADGDHHQGGRHTLLVPVPLPAARIAERTLCSWWNRGRPNKNLL
jgi:hypothetical protein